jgi:hypothetical protein
VANQRDDGSDKTFLREIVLQKHHPLSADITWELTLFRIPPECPAGSIDYKMASGVVFLLNLA